MLVQNNRKELKDLLNCVAAVFPQDVVVGFDNVASAISYANDRPVDMCFADVEMKSTSGFALTEELRSKNKNIRVNLIADCTDYAIDAWRFHINDYLVRPITQEAVLHTVGC